MTTKTKVTITITIILLIIAVGYRVFDEGSNYLNNQRGLYYQAGYQDHYTNEYSVAQTGKEIIQGGMLPEVEV